MRFPPDILDEIRARLPVSAVVGRKVALKKAGREHRGLSPFKVEKTPSFFVNDQKGFYHCFASGEHGDIFTFLMKTEGLSFPEAVERLAADAGVQLPKPQARDAAAEERRLRLAEVVEEAARFYVSALASRAGSEARAYVARRGLSEETVARFRIGFAPPGRQALRQHLAQRGFSLEEMAVSGMVIAGEDIREPYDRFRNRVMFPILDLKGRVIAFGGRTLETSTPGGGHIAKYLNSPETPLFHKGRVLFNAGEARQAAHDAKEVIAVEGYMDVVQIVQAGFPQCVAPLGTALTIEQLELLWRMTPEPTLCFDGDSAGRKAAHRAIDTALPSLKPGFSLKFAFLPDGLDPDDLIRQQGAAAFRAQLAAARPLADVLWEREWAAGDWATPERRASLEKGIARLVEGIQDQTVRAHYGREMRDRLFAAFRTQSSAQPRAGGRQAAFDRGGRAGRARPAGGGFGRPAGTAAGASSRSRLRDTALAQGAGVAPPPREALILLTLLNHPWLVEDEAEAIAALPLTSAPLRRLRDAILEVQAAEISLDSASLRSQLDGLCLHQIVDLVERILTHRSDKFAEPGAEREAVLAGWRHTLALHERHQSLQRELAAAVAEYDASLSEASSERIAEINRLIASAELAETL